MIVTIYKTSDGSRVASKQVRTHMDNGVKKYRPGDIAPYDDPAYVIVEGKQGQHTRYENGQVAPDPVSEAQDQADEAAKKQRRRDIRGATQDLGAYLGVPFLQGGTLDARAVDAALQLLVKAVANKR